MNWKLKPQPPQEFINQFPEYEPIVLQLLHARALRDQKAIDEFFNPDYDEDLHDPFLMLGMDRAVKRILKAVKKQEPIVIFGDYDADGICGAAILQKTFKVLGANLMDTYIPDRAREGYGLNFEAISALAKKGVKLIITVDCGITDIKEVGLANSLGMETVIIDHHEVIDGLPKAVAIVDPHQKGDRYPFKDLAAAGVAFKVAQAMLRKIKNEKLKIKNEILDGWEKWLLDFVAIATVADCVSLLGENRTLVKYGLVVLAQTNKPGLKELLKIARIAPTLDLRNLETNLDAYTLGFILGPRLNAASRMKHANVAYELLVTESDERAKDLAKEIDQKNHERQVLTDKIMVDVSERLQHKKDKPFVIFEGNASWPIGLIGLVAGRLVDKYCRPTIIYSETDKFCKASCRSIAKFDLIEAFKKINGLLLEFGGHPQSAGFNFKKDNAAAIAGAFDKLARESLKDDDLSVELEIDAQIKPQDINFSFFDRLQRFAPFGEDNPKPHFLMQNLEIFDIKNVGPNGKHMKFIFSSSVPSLLNGVRGGERGGAENKKFKAIGFNLTVKNGHLKVGDRVDVVFELLVDEWNGNRELQMKIIDIRKTG